MGPLDLANYVQQQGEMGRERGTNTRLNQLAGQAYGASPQDQRGLVQQAIQTDRGQGMALGKSLGADHQERTNRAAQKVGMFVKVYKANPQMAGGMYPGIAQEVGQLFPEMQIPQEFSPEFLPGLEQFAASMGNGADGSNVQSTYVDGEGNRVAIMRDGSQKVLGANDAGMQGQTITVQGDDGKPRQMTFNKRTMTYEPAQMGGQPQGQPMPQQTQQRAPGEVPFSIDPSLPPQVQAAIRANEPQWAQVADQSQMQIPQQPQSFAPPQQSGSMFTGRSPDEQAALTTAAQERAKINALPVRGQIEAMNAGMTTAAQEASKLDAYTRMTQPTIERESLSAQAKADAKRQVEQRDRTAALRVYETAMEGLNNGLSGTSTGPVSGRLPAFSTEQQVAEGAVAAMAPILKQLFRASGEGVFTDKDQEMLMRMVPTRTDTPDARASKMQNIDNIVRAKMRAAPQDGQDRAPSTAVRRATNPQTGQVLELRNGQWVPAQ